MSVIDGLMLLSVFVGLFVGSVTTGVFLSTVYQTRIDILESRLKSGSGRFFSFDGVDGTFSDFDTAKEAEDATQALIDESSHCDGEWHEGVELTCWGEILGCVRMEEEADGNFSVILLPLSCRHALM